MNGARADTAALFVALIAFASCDGESVTALDIRVTVTGSIDQIEVQTIRLDGAPLSLAAHETLLPQPPRLLATADVLTLWLPDRADLKPVVVTLQGYRCGQMLPGATAMTAPTIVHKGQSVATDVALTAPPMPSCGGTAGAGGTPGTGGRGGDLGRGGGAGGAAGVGGGVAGAGGGAAGTGGGLAGTGGGAGGAAGGGRGGTSGAGGAVAGAGGAGGSPGTGGVAGTGGRGGSAGGGAGGTTGRGGSAGGGTGGAAGTGGGAGVGTGGSTGGGGGAAGAAGRGGSTGGAGAGGGGRGGSSGNGGTGGCGGTGQMMCTSGCINTNNDPMNCGSCGRRCQAPEPQCIGGVCGQTLQ